MTLFDFKRNLDVLKEPILTVEPRYEIQQFIMYHIVIGLVIIIGRERLYGLYLFYFCLRHSNKHTVKFGCTDDNYNI